ETDTVFLQYQVARHRPRRAATSPTASSMTGDLGYRNSLMVGKNSGFGLLVPGVESKVRRLLAGQPMDPTVKLCLPPVLAGAHSGKRGPGLFDFVDAALFRRKPAESLWVHGVDMIAFERVLDEDFPVDMVNATSASNQPPVF